MRLVKDQVLYTFSQWLALRSFFFRLTPVKGFLPIALVSMHQHGPDSQV